MGKKPTRIGKIPAFVKKLVQILDDPNSSGMICWLPEGSGFQILNITSFAQNVLPRHFKHKNMASFVRQLNMYGFNRPKQTDQNIYINPRFQKGNVNNMKFIKRKVTTSKNSQDQIHFQDESEQNSPQENSNLFLMEEYQKLLIENQQLRKQNQELTIKLSHFEDIKTKIKKYTQQMQKFITEPNEQTQNQKAEKQANSSNSSTDNSFQSNQSSFKKGFSIVNNNLRPLHESSYQILLGGVTKVEPKQKQKKQKF